MLVDGSAGTDQGGRLEIKPVEVLVWVVKPQGVSIVDGSATRLCCQPKR